MIRFPTFSRVAWLTGALALSAVCGCQSTSPSREPASAGKPSSEPTNVMAGSDAERAKAGIDRNQREKSGERRPFDPGAGRPVDQPPTRR
jgi:hypothetical protein